MPVKVTLAEIKKITKKTLWQNILFAMLFIGVGAATVAIALQELIRTQWFWSVMAWIFGLVFIFIGLLPLFMKTLELEIALRYTPSELDAMRHLEMVKSGDMSHREYMERHGDFVYSIGKLITDELKLHKDEVLKAQGQWKPEEKKETAPIMETAKQV